MDNNEIDLRKEKIIKFIKKNKHWVQYIILFIILWLTVFIRKQNWNLLKDFTTGKYISLELDSELFLRYAQYIAEHGRLFDVDMMRNYPLGVHIDFGTYVSYFVAYLYKILHVFVPSVTVEFVDVIYPTVATVLAALFLFLFVRRLFNYKVALLSALFLVISPNFLFRSISSDHDILGLMFIFMTLYFFAVGYQSSKIKYNILFGTLAAFSSILGYNSAGNVSIFFMIVGLFILIHVLLDNIKKSDIYTYIIWYIVTFTILLLTGGLSLQRYFTDSTSSLPATFAFLSLLVYLLLEHKKIKNHYFYNSILKKLPKGFISVVLVGILGFLFLILFLGPSYMLAMIRGFFGIFSHAFVGNRWSSTVAENRRIFLIDWFSSFGSILVWLFILGLILLVYKLVKGLKDYKKLFYVYFVCIFAFIFSKYSENSILNGKSSISRFLFYGSIFVIVIYTMYYYIKNYYESGKTESKFVVDLNWKYTFILVIALVNVVGGTSAVRLFFELSPFVIIISSYTLIFLFDYFLALKSHLLKYLGVLFLAFLLLNPFSFARGLIMKDIDTSYNQVKFSGPSYNKQWQLAGQWVRENTSGGAVFNHWWDYGYWVQSGFDRITVTDGGNRIGWWNYLTARNILTAPRDENALGFLYAHGVDYLLIVGDEVGKYPAYSLIGSDKDLDRYSYLSLMGLDNSLTQDTRNGSLLVYGGGYALDEDFIYGNGGIYPKGSVVGFVLINVEKILDNNGTVIGSKINQPKMVVVDNGQGIQFSLKCIYLDKLYTFENYDYGGCIRVIPVLNNGNLNNIGAVVFMSRRVTDSLFGRLYLLGQDSSYFKLVYNDDGSVPLALLNGRQIGPIKIWKVQYPDEFSLNAADREYYTMKQFSDLSLTEF